MWSGYREAGGAMEYRCTEPKLIDFFKWETPLRQDHGCVGEQTRTGSLQLGRAGSGASAPAPPAIADGERSDLQLEPSSGAFVDFLGGNGDDTGHHLGLSRSSMAPKWLQEAVARDRWSVVTARPNLALKLLSPSPTGTQASGTSPPKTPTFDMELNSRVPDLESSAFSADSDRRLFGAVLPDQPPASSRASRWSPKRLKVRDGDGVVAAGGSNVDERDEEEEREAVVQAAASLLSLSSHEDDWRPTSSPQRTSLRRNASSSSLAAIGEGETKAPDNRGKGSVISEGSGPRNRHGKGHENGNAPSTSLAVTGEGSGSETKAPFDRGTGSVSAIGPGSGPRHGKASSSTLAAVGERPEVPGNRGKGSATGAGSGRRNASPPSLAGTGERSDGEAKAPGDRGEGSAEGEGQHGHGNASCSSSMGGGDGCSSGSSVLSRPSSKRRYRRVVDVLADSPRVR